jgi:hypothetical protein
MPVAAGKHRWLPGGDGRSGNASSDLEGDVATHRRWCRHARFRIVRICLRSFWGTKSLALFLQSARGCSVRSQFWCGSGHGSPHACLNLRSRQSAHRSMSRRLKSAVPLRSLLTDHDFIDSVRLKYISGNSSKGAASA